jgi:hypothetical protein
MGTPAFSRSFVFMNISGCTFIFDISFDTSAQLNWVFPQPVSLPAQRIRLRCI